MIICATLLKIDSNTGVFPWNLQNFKVYLCFPPVALWFSRNIPHHIYFTCQTYQNFRRLWRCHGRIYDHGKYLWCSVFAKILKCSVIDVLQGSNYTSGFFLRNKKVSTLACILFCLQIWMTHRFLSSHHQQQTKGNP